MTRLSLSPEPTEWQQGRYRLNDDSDSDSDSTSDSDDNSPTFNSYVHLSSFDDECKYSDSDNADTDADAIEEEEEEERDWPHPFGFSLQPNSSWGKTRFGLDINVEVDMFVDFDSSVTDNNNNNHNKNKSIHNFAIVPAGILQARRQTMQSFPPIENYMDAKIAPTASLLNFNAHQERAIRLREENDRDMSQITALLEASSLVDASKTLALIPQPPLPTHDPLLMLASAANEIKKKMERDRQYMQQEHTKATNALKRLLQQNEKRANAILQQEQQNLEVAKQEQEAKEKAAEQQRMQGEADARALQEETEAAAVAQQKEADDLVAAKAAVEAKEKAKTEYLEKAKKLVGQLTQLRASIEPFEQSKAVSKRRLQMKKVVRGKVNTLSENAQKIQQVAQEVSKAIADARAEDEQLKQQMAAGNAQISPEMSKGKRYLVDLLASSIMVRVQAEGFNGLRGDGFPIANMLALVSVDSKELIPIFAAHIYTICPIAIPKLPTPAEDATEDALMKSLGMAQDKNGEYETFARFLLRTEGIISLIANIMASNPPNHILMDGHKGAVLWLQRFLKILPATPASPLPLLTAPVLCAFLTGAGHMLANVHPEHLKSILHVITSDIINRLDEGPVGQPSAIRLKKTVKDGFEGFKNNLPHKALPELYYGANGNVGGTGATFQPSHEPGGAGLSQSSPNPNSFTGTGSNSMAAPSVPNPFAGGGPIASTGSSSGPFGKPPMPNTFGKTSSGMSGASVGSTGPQSSGIFGGSSSFGNTNANTANASHLPSSGNSGFGSSAPFGGSSMESGPISGSLTGFRNSTNNAGGFGQPSSNPTPFTSSANNAGGFGQPSSNPSPFAGSTTNAGGFGQPNSNPSPFGAPATQAHQSPFAAPASKGQSSFGVGMTSNPFGGGNQQQQQSPFGGGIPSSSGNFGSVPTNPFGGGNQQQQQSPFGGGGNQQGKKKGPCKFFAQGKCRNGSNCEFSHDMQGGQGNGQQQSSPFGGFRQQQQQQTTPFGGGGIINQGGQSGSNRPPCKFFVQGTCRNGSNCKFSHDTQGGNGGGQQTSNPFGGGGGFGGGKSGFGGNWQ